MGLIYYVACKSGYHGSMFFKKETKMMKSNISLVATMLASLTLIGCASTAPTVMTDYPELVPASTAVYKWDDSISEALNVARMAQPAGVGHGMRDYAKGEFAKDGRESGLSRTLGAGLMFLSQGIYGAVADTTMSNRAEQNMNWRSSLVTFIPVDELDNTEKPFRYAQLHVASKIDRALKIEYPEMQWLGTITPNRSGSWNAFNTTFVFFDSAACKASLQYSSTNKDKLPSFYGPRNPNNNIDGIHINVSSCEYGGKLTIAGRALIDGKQNYILVFESTFGQYFDEVFAKHFEGYAIFPQKFTFRPIDTYGNMTVTRPYPVVFKKGIELLFESPQ